MILGSNAKYIWIRKSPIQNGRIRSYFEGADTLFKGLLKKLVGNKVQRH